MSSRNIDIDFDITIFRINCIFNCYLLSEQYEKFSFTFTPQQRVLYTCLHCTWVGHEWTSVNSLPVRVNLIRFEGLSWVECRANSILLVSSVCRSWAHGNWGLRCPKQSDILSITLSTICITFTSPYHKQEQESPNPLTATQNKSFFICILYHGRFDCLFVFLPFYMQVFFFFLINQQSKLTCQNCFSHILEAQYQARTRMG